MTFVTRILTHYRIPFHERVRVLLDDAGVEYRVVHGQPDAEEAAKGDLATLPWADRVSNQALFGRGKLVWQPVLRQAMASDLVVIGQENQLLVNYPLQLLQVLPLMVRPRIALWGHGRNFQARNSASGAERWKRFWAKRCDWWFAYTHETRKHIERLGYPAERITVFNNAVDTGALAATADAISDADAAEFAGSLGAKGDNIAIFVGGLYPDKRLGFLVAAADLIRARVPDFTLIVVGGGQDKAVLDALAAGRPWLIVTGPRFGPEKVALMRMAKLFLMPGLLGLAVLDAGVLALPVVTTRYPWHSPEIAYLNHDETGVIVEDWRSEEAYAQAVITLLLDKSRREDMAVAARRHVANYTIESMADRFTEGVVEALAAPRR